MATSKQRRREWHDRNDAYIAGLPPFPCPVGKCDDCGYQRLRLQWHADRWTCEVCEPALAWKGRAEEPAPCPSCPSTRRP